MRVRRWKTARTPFGRCAARSRSRFRLVVVQLGSSSRHRHSPSLTDFRAMVNEKDSETAIIPLHQMYALFASLRRGMNQEVRMATSPVRTSRATRRACWPPSATRRCCASTGLPRFPHRDFAKAILQSGGSVKDRAACNMVDGALRQAQYSRTILDATAQYRHRLA